MRDHWRVCVQVVGPRVRYSSWFGGLASTLDYTRFEPREFIAQNDKVVSLVYSEATVRATRRAFVNPEAHVWTLRDGKLARFQSYHDTAAAAAAHRVARISRPVRAPADD